MPHLVTNRERHFAANKSDHRRWEHFAIGSFNHILHTSAAACFLVASFLFLESILLLHDAQGWFVAGAILFLLVVIIDAIETCVAVVRLRNVHNRPRLKFWATIEILAGLFFIAGAVLILAGAFHVHESEELTKTIFALWIAGDICYIVAIMLNMHQVWQAPSQRLMQAQNNVTALFLTGKVLFLCGTVCHHITHDEATLLFAGWLYIAGSILFLVGSIGNAARAVAAFLFHRKTEPAVNRPGALGGWKPRNPQQFDGDGSPNQVIPGALGSGKGGRMPRRPYAQAGAQATGIHFDSALRNVSANPNAGGAAPDQYFGGPSVGPFEQMNLSSFISFSHPA